VRGRLFTRSDFVGWSLGRPRPPSMSEQGASLSSPAWLSKPHCASAHATCLLYNLLQESVSEATVPKP
jgi:hypothetical protein